MWKASKHVMRYLKGTKRMGIVYWNTIGPYTNYNPIGYSDSDWAQ